MRESYENGRGSPAWLARMSARLACFSAYFPRSAVNKIFWMRDTNFHSNYKAVPRFVEALRASWDAINCSIEAKREGSAWYLMLVDGLSGYGRFVA